MAGEFVVFIAVFLLTLGAGVISVLIALVLGRVVPRARIACNRCISCWTTTSGLRNRLLLAPPGITLAILVGIAVVGMSQTGRIRSRICDSSRLVVLSGGNSHRVAEREEVLFETEDSSVIEDLAEQITLGFEWIGSPCLCCGGLTFELYREGHRHYSFSLHHGRTIREEESAIANKDLSYSSRSRLSDWLVRMGVPAESHGQ